MSTVQLITNILVLQTFYTGYGPAKKKKPEDPQSIDIQAFVYLIDKNMREQLLGQYVVKINK